MQSQLVSLTKEFIELESAPGNPRALEQILEAALSRLDGFTIERFEHNSVPSALVYSAKSRPAKFDVLLNAHLDIIPGKPEQLVPRIKGDRLYGVGAMDMKAGAVCLIEAFKAKAVRSAWQIGLQLTVDEELGGFDGAKYQIEQGVRADFVLAGEPTNFDIVYQAKGIWQVKISAPGLAAHGAYPWRGKNAISKMQEFLISLQEAYPQPDHEAWVTTVNVARIETSNGVFNKVPDDCTVWLDVRFVPEDAAAIRKAITDLMPDGFTLEAAADEPAMFSAPDNSYIQMLTKVSEAVLGKKMILRGANGTSDARHFVAVGGAGVEFGPIGGGIGSDEEWVNVPSIEQYYEIITKFLGSGRGSAPS